MAKRRGALGSAKKIKHPHKTKKRLAIKKEMLAKRAEKKGKKIKSRA